MIETKRCKIVKLHENDYESVRKLHSNEKVRQFLGGIVSEERFHDSFNSMMASGDDSFYWVVLLKSDNEFIGLISIDKHHDGSNMEVSYQFLPKWWGYGYAEEVIRNIIDYVFGRLKIKKLVAETQSANKASCKLLQKVGMSLEQVTTRFGAEQYIFSISKDTI